MDFTLDLETGRFSPSASPKIRTLADLGPLFSDQAALQTLDLATVVYEVHNAVPEVEGPPRLLSATTIIYPGQVGKEYFMTRGHFHVDAQRGEFMLTLAGEGSLILMDRERETWSEPMTRGSVHDIDGRFAHRVVNTGSTPLVFLVVWMSDCGHDYASILSEGFGKRMVAGVSGPELQRP